MSNFSDDENSFHLNFQIQLYHLPLYSELVTCLTFQMMKFFSSEFKKVKEFISIVFFLCYLFSLNLSCVSVNDWHICFSQPCH